MSWLSPRDGDLPPDENVGPVLMWISGVLMFFILLTTALRLWVRFFNRALGFDDAAITLSVACAITRLAFLAKQHEHGNGRHMVYLTPENYTKINMYGWYAQIFLFSSTAFLKVSIGLLILRLKDTKPLKIVTWTVMALVCITNFGVVIILLAECKPAGFWRGKNAVCWPNRVRIYSIYATIAVSVLTDLIFSLAPLVVVWKVKIPLRTKISVCALMSLGLVATGFGIARAASLGITTTDLSWAYCIAAIWSNLELFIGIIAANLALARSIYVFVRSGGKTTTTTGTSSTSATRTFASQKLRSDRCAAHSTVIESSRKQEEELDPDNASDIPLEPGIRKETEFWLSEEDLENKRRRDLQSP